MGYLSLQKFIISLSVTILGQGLKGGINLAIALLGQFVLVRAPSHIQFTNESPGKAALRRKYFAVILERTSHRNPRSDLPGFRLYFGYKHLDWKFLPVLTGTARELRSDHCALKALFSFLLLGRIDIGSGAGRTCSCSTDRTHDGVTYC